MLFPKSRQVELLLTAKGQIVARSPDQRDWIVEEVLTSLTKMSDLRLSKASYL